MNVFCKAISATTLLSFALTAQALSAQPGADQAASVPSPTKPGMHLVLNGGLTYGGDTLFTATYTTGGSTNIKAGSLVQFGIGALYQFDDSPLALMLSANYHTDFSNAKNGDMSFNRVPVEILAYYTGKQKMRLGGGLRLVNSPEASATINGATTKYTFDNTTGIVGEVGFQMSPQGWLYVRFVSEKYNLKTNNGVNVTGAPSLNGSHLGVNFGYEF